MASRAWLHINRGGPSRGNSGAAVHARRRYRERKDRAGRHMAGNHLRAGNADTRAAAVRLNQSWIWFPEGAPVNTRHIGRESIYRLPPYFKHAGGLFFDDARRFEFSVLV